MVCEQYISYAFANWNKIEVESVRLFIVSLKCVLRHKVSFEKIKRSFKDWCATKVDEEGNYVRGTWGNCGPECPFKNDAWSTDDALKVTHHHSLDQREIMIAPKLLGIMASSLLLIGLMVTGLGISGIEI